MKEKLTNKGKANRLKNHMKLQILAHDVNTSPYKLTLYTYSTCTQQINWKNRIGHSTGEGAQSARRRRWI